MTATVDFVVAERKKELERHRVAVGDAGVEPIPADDTPAQVVLTLTPADAAALRAGELRPSVAFMRGTMKMAGDYGVLLHVLPLLERAPAPLL
jgi:putative sterol carrier protein